MFRKPNTRNMKTFWIRTASAVVYVVLFLGTLLSGYMLKNPQLGLGLFAIFVAFVTLGCTYEFFRIVERQGAQPNRVLGYLYVVAVLLLVTLVPMCNLR